MRIADHVVSTTVAIVAIVFGALSGSQTHGQSTTPGDWFLGDVRAPSGLVPETPDRPIVIAIVDDGMRITHRDLEGFIWTSPQETPDNRIDDDGNGYVDDVHGWDVSDGDGDVAAPGGRTDLFHGTHVGGIVASIARAAYGESGSRFIQIMPVKSLADDAATTYITDGYRGIEYAIQAGADIIVTSWGVGQITPEESRILQDASDNGILIVASAGNLPEEREQYPAAHDSVLAVTSTDRNGQKTANSNFGQFIDISAPGVEIRSASDVSDDSYAVRDGTSFSAAMVATAAALVKLHHPLYSLKEIEACLKSSADPVDIPAFDYSAKLGAGKLNIDAAVTCGLLADETPETNRLIHSEVFLHGQRADAASITWAIEPPGEFEGIRFRPVLTQDDAARGTIEFRADGSRAAAAVASYPLDALPDSIYVPGTTAYVTFTPGDGTAAFDWLLEYEAEAIDFSTLYCSGTENIGVEGTLTDGSGPENYSPRTDCRWLITAPEGQVIRFQFDELDTEARTDQIFLFNGPGTLQDQLMAIFSGSELPSELTTWSNQVLVWFVTDGQGQGQGWRAEYRFQDP